MEQTGACWLLGAEQESRGQQMLVQSSHKEMLQGGGKKKTHNPKKARFFELGCGIVCSFLYEIKA